MNAGAWTEPSSKQGPSTPRAALSSAGGSALKTPDRPASRRDSAPGASPPSALSTPERPALVAGPGINGTPGAPDSAQVRNYFGAQAALLKTVQSSQDAGEERHQELVELLAKNLAPLSADEPRVDDKLYALTGLKFDLQLPVLKDSDVDFARHWRNFKSIIDCHAYGRKGVRPLDMLTVLRKTLPTGRVRLRTYDTLVDRARRMGKLPDEAAKVFDELQIKLRRCIRETQDQKCFRLAEEFRQLSMGRTSHSEFHSKWEEVVKKWKPQGCRMT